MIKHKMITIGLILISILITNDAASQIANKEKDKELWEKALQIHRDAMVIDAHAHRPVFGKKDQQLNHPDATQVDIELLKAGGIDGLGMYFAYYPIKGKPLYAKVKNDLMYLHKRVKEYAPEVTVASDLSSFKNGLERTGPVVLPGVEYFFGALDGQVSSIDSLHKLGVKVLMLMDNEHERLSFGSVDTDGNRALNPLAQQTIERMNALGMLIDITHLDDHMQEKVIEYSDAPVIASHSSMRSVYNVQRNMPDHLVKKLAKKGGAIMITFNSGDLAGVKEGRCQIEKLIDHIDRAVKIAGIDHVGIGSDFNGSGKRSPAGLEDASGFPLITYHLLMRGYTEEQIRKVLGENYIRLLSKVMD
ncbi:MAG: dipeptidase [Bacteroidales bacterium]|nr:dipeptidase [Bacteroidales bacterium]